MSGSYDWPRKCLDCDWSVPEPRPTGDPFVLFSHRGLEPIS